MTVPVDPPSQATRSAEDAIAALIAARRRRLARCEFECSMVIKFLRRKWFFAANAFIFPQKSARTLGASTSGQHTRIVDSTTPPVHRTHRASTARSARGVFLPISLERVAASAGISRFANRRRGPLQQPTDPGAINTMIWGFGRRQSSGVYDRCFTQRPTDRHVPPPNQPLPRLVRLHQSQQL